MEYEDVLPYSEFSVRLPQHAIYRLPQVLQDIMDTPGKVIPHSVRRNDMPTLSDNRVGIYLPASRQILPLLMPEQPMLTWSCCRLNESDVSILDGQNAARMVVQVEQMQQMLHCVWAFFSWKEGEGRALEGLMCSLRRKLYGSHEAQQPTIDPKTCQLSCNVQT